MGKLLKKLEENKILLSDGAWGTRLIANGLTTNDCPDEWSISHYEVCKQIAKAYYDAGSDLVETNSFGASPIKLNGYNLSNQCREINIAAAKATKEASNGKLVVGSIGPTGKMLLMGEVTEEELYDGFRLQAKSLEEGGVDAILIETMTDMDEAKLALKAVKENTGVDSIVTFTFDKGPKGYHTMMGATPEQVAEIFVNEGADVVGTNCGNGIENIIEIVKIMRKVAPKAYIMAQANAGLPIIQFGKTVYPESPEKMSSFVKELAKAGANIIGGCCGTTPEHIHQMRIEIDQIQ